MGKKRAAMGAMKVMKKKAAMKAMKVMKKKAAMKAMKAMKKKSVSKIARGSHAKSMVLRGSKEKTAFAKKSPWIQAVTKARKALKITGFAAIKGHSSVCKGQGVLQPVSATLSNMRVGSGEWRHRLQVWG